MSCVAIQGIQQLSYCAVAFAGLLALDLVYVAQPGRGGGLRDAASWASIQLKVASSSLHNAALQQ